MRKTLLPILFGLFIVGSVIYYGKSYVQKFANHDTTKTIIEPHPTIVDPYQYIAMDQMGINPESTLKSREMGLTIPYIIHDDPSEKTVIVNFPTFLNQTLVDQDKFYQKVSSLGSYKLTMSFYSFDSIDIGKFQFFGNNIPQYERLTLNFYTLPTNYHEVFKRGYWQNLDTKALDVQFIGNLFPDGFSMHSFLRHLSEMLTKPLSGNAKLNEIHINFDEINDFYFAISDTGTGVLGSLPTRSLSTMRILIDSRTSGPGEALKGEQKLKDFFQNSPIKTVKIEGSGRKENGVITLEGF